MILLRRLVPSVSILLGLVVNACGGDDGPSDEPTSRIVFHYLAGNSSYRLYSLDPDRGTTTPILVDGFSNRSPALSPDGRRLAFATNRDGNYEIYVATLATGAVLRITEDTLPDDEPAWAPDGSQLVFSRTSQTDVGSGLYIIALDGSPPRPLTTGGEDHTPAWSPIGDKIAFDHNPGRVWVVDTSGANPHELVATTTTDGMPAWSPDGSKLAFLHVTDNGQEIFVMDSDGTNAASITPDITGNIEPTWSPDGKYIAFSGFRGGRDQIIRRLATGGSDEILTTLPRSCRHPSWGRMR